MDGIASILVIDDNPKFLKDALPMYGYDVEVAEDGIEGLKVLSNKSFDLILLDVMMPNMDGWDTLKAIRKNPKTEHIPVIMITAVNEDQKVVSGLRIGADDYIVKDAIEIMMKASNKYNADIVDSYHLIIYDLHHLIDLILHSLTVLLLPH